MKRNFLKRAFVCLFTVVILNSCKKDDEVENGGISGNTLTVAVVNGNSYNEQIDSVKLEMEVKDGQLTFATAEYKNGGFTLVLPKSVPSRYLNLLGVGIDGITISNKNAKGIGGYMSAYKSGYGTGYIHLRSGDWEGRFIYVDRDVFVTGNGTTETYNDKTIYIYQLQPESEKRMEYRL
jgi:hypothetical protein